jgi:hypothetical protein
VCPALRFVGVAAGDVSRVSSSGNGLAWLSPARAKGTSGGAALSRFRLAYGEAVWAAAIKSIKALMLVL